MRERFQKSGHDAFADYEFLELFRKVLSDDFNRTVIKELIKDLDPNGVEKTLIYAVTDDHADTVVRILKEKFVEMGCPADDDAIQKITGSIDKPSQSIRLYKNEHFPNIAVTVDLLTTGIDELKLALDLNGFTEKTLRVAWQAWTNEDIAADVISFIRRQALGDPLLSHADRIMNAILHDIEGELLLGDSLSSRAEKLKDFDVILANPPFGTKKIRIAVHIRFYINNCSHIMRLSAHGYKGLQGA